MSNTSYPLAIDTPTNPSSSSTLATVPHHTQHGLANDALVALETKLGYGASNQTITGSGMYLVSSAAGQSQWVSTLTTPNITTSLLDTNGNTWIGQTATSTAVNYVNITDNSTGNAPIIGSKGSDTNIDLNVTSQGSGKVRENGSSHLDFRTSFANFIQSGGVWTQTSGLVGTMTAMQLWINGIEYNQTTVASHTFGASSDTYVDYTAGTGLVYTAVANNAASPALAVNSIRVAIIITSGAAITSINQGSSVVTAPVASSIIYSVTDSLGNLIYPNVPQQTILGYRQITGNFSTAATGATQITGLSAPVVIPAGNRKIRISAYSYALSNTGGNNDFLTIWDGTVGSGTQLTVAQNNGTTGGASVTAWAVVTPAAGTKTYNAGLHTTAGTATINAASTYPAFILVEAL